MLKILHIERAEFFRKLIREVVGRCGHTVTSVATRAEAISRLAEGEVDIIITGLELEDGSGEDFIVELNGSKWRDLPIIVVTSTDTLEARERLFSLGVSDYMLKGDISFERFKRYFDNLEVADELSRFIQAMRVAVLDDSLLIRKIIKNILEMNGIKCIDFYEDPRDFFASQKRYDLNLIDIVLPGMSGEEVIGRLRERGDDGVVICVTKLSDEKPISNALLCGADDYVVKPFTATQLMARIRINAKSHLLFKRLQRLVIHDGLTGLFNHKHSFDRLAEEAQKSHRYGHPLSVIMIDVDDFKLVNDEFGHSTGDNVLATLAEELKTQVRTVDIVGRYGGEEFIIALPETTLSEGLKVAEKLCAAVAALKFDQEKVAITVSCGVAELKEGEKIEVLVDRADDKLYEAKHGGKNRIAG